jgi:ATP-dependent protease ClpP protease subunit
MKLQLALFLALCAASCATVRKPTTNAPRDVVAATKSAPKTAATSDDGPPLSPLDLLRLLNNETETPPPPAPDCSHVPFCVVYHRFDGVVNDEAVNPAIAAIKSAQPDQIVLLDINTRGGSVASGFQLEKALEATKSRVFCVVDGEAMSMGFFMLQSCQMRVMTKRSELMAHEVRMVHQGTITIHDASMMISDMIVNSRAYAEQVLRRSKLTYDEYHAKVDGKEWFISWPEALQAGVVDCVYNGTGAQALDEIQHTGTLTCVK